MLGDNSLKVLRIDMTKWGSDDCLTIAADIEIEGFEVGLGRCVNRMACMSPAKSLHVAVTSTGGRLHGFSLPGRGAATHGA